MLPLSVGLFVGLAQEDRLPGTVFRRLILGLFLVCLAGGIGYFFAPTITPEAYPPASTATLTARSVAHVEHVKPSKRVQDIQKTDALVHRELNRHLSTPEIANTTLNGFSIEEVVAGARVPAFFYTEDNGNQLVVFAYNYSLLDQHTPQLQLSPRVLQQLEDEFHFVTTQMQDHHTVLWRSRDEIFVAVTQHNPQSLIERIQR